MNAAAIVVAAGRGERLAAGVPKAFIALAGRSLLAHALVPLAAHPEIAEIVAVVPADRSAHAERILDAVRGAKRRCLSVVGGRERQDSVRAGLEAISATCDVILVHDAARPFASAALVGECLRVAAEKGAVIAALPARDTVKEVGADGAVARTLERHRLWLVQTPQAFRADLLREAHARALRDGVVATDDAALLESYGTRVWVVPGEAANVKITTPEDLEWAEWWVRRSAEPR